MDNRERLNQLGEQWPGIRAHGSLSERKNTESEIFLLIAQLFPKQIDVIGNFFLKDWPSYAPEKGALYKYCSYQLRLRSKDQYAKDHDIHRLQKKDKKTGEKSIEVVCPQSLQEKVNEDSETERQDMLMDSERYATDAAVMADARMVQLLTLMLRLPQELRGRANNPQRLNYFRMFFTDSVADIAQNQEGISSLEERERDLFQVLQLAFLDFFQVQNCRTVAQLRGSQSKPYGQLVPGRPMTDPGHPLPNDVYCVYFEAQEGTKIGASTLSNQRTAYKELLEGYLC